MIICRIFSYLFHPLFMPFTGTMAFYMLSPQHIPYESRKNVILPILILTVLIPIVLYLLLKHLGWVQSHELRSAKERKIPLYAAITITYVIILHIAPPAFSPTLHYFFVGIMSTLFLCLLLVILNVKASIHMMGITGVAAFIFGFSLHFQVNTAPILAALVIISGVIAVSRLYLRAHTPREIATGALIGTIPQLVIFCFLL
ncbi:hypothetical protein [Sinomicrobium soli]|uniref:hypothetical protein n=1 Tax=Sinomicrobium sp. N-1-3-6 TaxID=2219864 RepID=UPI000DCBA4A0|nr:hypothetical protein [Sinomicrobium sp. N-1-3-6]RAV27987.1 hypothetical protein DN748_15680 [Sinomicrobium sp. N-1-3-6]